MARSITTIKNEIQTQVRTYPAFNVFKFPEEGGSATSIFNLIIYVVATAIYTFEVILDKAKRDLQKISDAIPAGNTKWIQGRIKAFQYGDIIGFDSNGVPAYSVIDTAKCIVTQCSVKQLSSGVVQIKVAKGTSPNLTPLSNDELVALKNYYFGTSTQQGIGFAGVRTEFMNLNADRLRLTMTVYYYGQYVASNVKLDVIEAIENFLGSFTEDSFDGTILMIKLIDAIQQVEGVSRVALTTVTGRAASVAIANATVVDWQGYYATIAGYAIPEDTSGYTLNDTITMTEETI